MHTSRDMGIQLLFWGRYIQISTRH